MARKVQREPERKLSLAAWFGIGCGASLALGLIVLGVIFGLAKASPPLPPEATAGRTATGTTTSADPAAPGQPAVPGTARPTAPTAAPQAPPLRQQIQQVERVARSGQPTPMTITIRQDELNALIAQESPPDVQNMRIYFGDGTMAGTGNVTWRGQTVGLTVRARPIVSGGELDVQVLEVRVGRLAAPSAIHDEVRNELSRALRRLSSQNKAQIHSVTVRPDAMIVSGQVGGR